MLGDLRSSLLAVLVLTLVFGLAYPLAMTGISQVVFPDKAGGSRIERGGEVVGSRLIGQDFRRQAVGADGEPSVDDEGEPVLEADPRFFQSRPSVTGYDADGTFFNNLGPNSRDLRDMFAANLEAYLALERPASPGLRPRDVPPDAIQTTASGLDPHISEANARIQARRVAGERNLSLERVLDLLDEHTDGRALGVLGEPGVNVLELNLAIDEESS